MCEYFKCTDFNLVIEDNDHEYLTSTTISISSAESWNNIKVFIKRTFIS